jgi:uncharacterized protein (DUF305 family)
MDTKTLLSGLVGFFMGGLIVSVAATTFDKPKADTKSQEITMSEMTNSLRNKSGDDYDKEFIDHMIEHHEGALNMANLSAKNAKHSEIKAMSEDIVKNQTAEIDQMKKWQTEWGYTQNTGTSEHNGGH